MSDQHKTTGWRPIETAPMDGTVILLWLAPPVSSNDVLGWSLAADHAVAVGWWDGQWTSHMLEEGSADTEGYSSPIPIRIGPTHWMSLPEPPR